MAIIELDVDEFKSEYVKLRSNYGVGEVVNIAPMDEDETWYYMIRRPMRTLRFGAKLANLAKGSERETEELAIARAFGFPVLDCDLIVPVKQPREVQMWHCILCDNKKPITAFAPQVLIDRFNAGLIFASAIGHCCENCKRDKAKLYWKRAA